MPPIRPTWLDRVEAILRATTGDLRELAKIGGADPKTLYIGTSLNGVDIRGQDLRGMTFTQLELTKVIRDESTKIDLDQHLDLVTPNEGIEEELPHLARPIVLFTHDRIIEELLSTKLGQEIEIEIFESDRESEFRAACRVHQGPKFVVTEQLRGEPIYSIIDTFDRDVVVLVIQRGGKPILSGEDFRSKLEDSGPIILVPVNSVGGAGNGNALGSTLRCAIGILGSNWSHLVEIFMQQPISVFLRARGLAPNPLSDALCMLFVRLVRLDLSNQWGVRLISWSGSYAQNSNELGGILLPNLKNIRVNWPVKERPTDTVVLLDILRGRRQDKRPPYISVAVELLERVGWEVRQVHSDFNQLWQLAATRGDFEIVALTRQHDVQPRLYSSSMIRDFDLNSVRRLVLNESADELRVVNELVQAQELWVSIRDVWDWRYSDGSIWEPLRNQLRRLTKSPSSVYRTQYLSMFVRVAIHSERVEDEYPFVVIQALNEPEFSSRYNLAFSSRHHGPKVSLYLVKLSKIIDNYAYELIATFVLQVDGRGAAISAFTNHEVLRPSA